MDKKLTSQEIEQAVQVCSSKKTGGSGCSGCPLQGERRCVNRLFDALAEENKRLREELRWIPVEERLPEVRASRWAQYLGTEQWEPWMNQQYSDYVEAVIAYDIGDGLKKKVHPAYVEDGEWRLPGGTYLRSYAKVECWRPMPKEPEAE